MSFRTRFVSHCLRRGETLTATIITGDVCGCMSWRGTGYSAEWHRAGNPGAAIPDCNGTGILNTEETEITLKGFVGSEILLGDRNLPEDLKTEIGKIDAEHFLLYGQANVATGAFYDLTGFVERETDITYGGATYKVRKVFKAGTVGQISLLVKNA